MFNTLPGIASIQSAVQQSTILFRAKLKSGILKPACL